MEWVGNPKWDARTICVWGGSTLGIFPCDDLVVELADTQRSKR